MAFSPFLSRLRMVRPGVALLAVLLALRALVPTGFMATATEAGLQLAFCDASTALVAGSPHAHHHHHGQGTAADPACPFAQSGGPAPLPALPVLASDEIVPDQHVLPATERTQLASGPLRAQTPRGPPNLA